MTDWEIEEEGEGLYPGPSSSSVKRGPKRLHSQLRRSARACWREAKATGRPVIDYTPGGYWYVYLPDRPRSIRHQLMCLAALTARSG